MAVNKPIEKEKTSKLAKMLEGLHFPADKAKILSYVKQQIRSSEEKQYYDMLQNLLQKNLTDNKQYDNVYEIEKQTGLLTEQK